MSDNLSPNPFPNGKGNRNEVIPARRIDALPRLFAVGAVAIYRAAVSPVIHAIHGPACRFEPSCSVYARDAIAEYGVIRGGAMALWRIARCNPMGGHGFDPVRGGGVKR
jgi:putative membrane protein insertion efficiency factor